VVDLGGFWDLGVSCGFLIFVDNELRNGLFRNYFPDPDDSFGTTHTITHCQPKK